MKGRFKYLQEAWADEGLTLAERNGRWGNSFDAQRLISFARKQGREDAMIEAIYKANHVDNRCLSDFSVLLECAAKAGLEGAEAMLKSDQEVAEVWARIQRYVELGITAVPVVVINDAKVIHGAPEAEVLQEAFEEAIDN